MHRIPLLLAIMALAGCSSYASFPPLEGDSPSASASQEPVPTVIATAIDWCIARENYRQQEQPVAFSLPPSMDDPTYAAVAAQVPGAHEATTEDQNVIEIRSVRLFGLKAMVDMTVPRENMTPRLVTLELWSYPFQSWHVVGANMWRFNEQQLKRSEMELRQASADNNS